MTGASFTDDNPFMTVSRANIRTEIIKHTIAVVEDDQDFRLNLCRFLEKSGFDVWGTDSAENFYVSLLQKKADLVLVDLGLPGEDGLTLIQRLAALQIPVVALTVRLRSSVAKSSGRAP